MRANRGVLNAAMHSVTAASEAEPKAALQAPTAKPMPTTCNADANWP